MQVLVGARIFDGERFFDDHALVIDGARIAGLTPYAERPRGDGERDLGGGLIASGFIDVQVNGGGGALMNENPSVETVVRIAESHRRFGTTGLLPTLVTDAPEVTPAAIAAVREARQPHDVLISLGHADASCAEASAAGPKGGKCERQSSAGGWNARGQLFGGFWRVIHTYSESKPSGVVHPYLYDLPHASCGIGY
jgi:hypothetical protein